MKGTSAKGSMVHKYRWSEVHHFVKHMFVEHFVKLSSLNTVYVKKHSVFFLRLHEIPTLWESGFVPDERGQPKL